MPQRELSKELFTHTTQIHLSPTGSAAKEALCKMDAAWMFPV